MKILRLSYLFFATCLASCTLDNPSPLPTADFSVSPSSPIVGQVVTFSNLSSNASEFEWSSTPSVLNSALESPTFVFDRAGNYQITLIAKGESGISQITKGIRVRDSDLDISFSFAPKNPLVGDTVSFSVDADFNISSFFWSSNRGGFNSRESNPSFTFDEAGSYQISLIVIKEGKQTSTIKTVTVGSVATDSSEICTQIENRCNLRPCLVSKNTIVNGGDSTLKSQYEYTTVSGKTVISKLINQIGDLTNTNTYEYDLQARNTLITSVSEQDSFKQATYTEKIWDGCFEIRNNQLDQNKDLISYTLFAYDLKGRLIRSSVYDINDNLVNYTLIDDFNINDLPQRKVTFDFNDVRQTLISINYLDCQPITITGRDSNDNTLFQQRSELNELGFIAKTTTTSFAFQAGFSSTITTESIFEYSCE